MAFISSKIFLLALLGFVFASGQESKIFDWNELLMQNSNNVWFYTTSRVEPPNTAAAFVPYGGQSAFDGDSSTCWAEGVYGPGIGEEIWFSVPDNIAYLDIFNGNMRSPRNYKMNNRVGKLSIRLFLGMYETGRDIFGERRFYLTPLTEPQPYSLEDRGTAQRINIEYPYWKTIGKRDAAAEAFSKDWKGSQQPKMMLFANIRILNVYPGTLYDDTSISDIVIGQMDLGKKILRVYADQNGDTLKVDTPVQTGKVIDAQSGSLFLIQESSTNLNWSIVLVLGNEKSKEKAGYVLYHLPTATRFEANSIDENCEEILRFNKKQNQLYLIYHKKNNSINNSVLLDNLLRK